MLYLMMFYRSTGILVFEDIL